MSLTNRFQIRKLLILALVALALSLGSPAWTDAFRYTFTGQVLNLSDANNFPIDPMEDFSVGISVLEDVLYTIVIDYDRDGRVDNLSNPATLFADWIAGEHLGRFEADCTTQETFAALSTLEPWNTELNFVQPTPILSLIFLGSPRNTLFLVVPGFDGTPESLQVGISTAQTLELVCDLFGQGPVNIVSLLTLTEIVPVSSSSNPGGLGSVAGRVTDTGSGGHLNCTTVVAFVGDGPQGVGATNEDGDYVIQNLGFATYMMEVFAPGYIGQSKPVTLGRIQDVVNFELTASAANGAVTGVITDLEDGSPLSGVRVEAIQGITLLATTFTCAAGFYELRDLNLKGPDVTVLVSAPAYEFDVATVPIGTEHDVGLAKSFFPGTISGTIRDANGDGIEGATVSTVHTVLNIGPTATTNEDGFYLSTPLPDGSYLIHISKSGFISSTLEESVAGNIVTVGDSLEAGDTPAPEPMEGTGEGGCSSSASVGASSETDWRGRSGDISLLLVVALVLVWRGRRTLCSQLYGAEN